MKEGGGIRGSSALCNVNVWKRMLRQLIGQFQELLQLYHESPFYLNFHPNTPLLQPDHRSLYLISVYVYISEFRSMLLQMRNFYSQQPNLYHVRRFPNIINFTFPSSYIRWGYFYALILQVIFALAVFMALSAQYEISPNFWALSLSVFFSFPFCFSCNIDRLALK